MLKERDIETYLGIQRPLRPDRVEELHDYVRTMDACFPTAVIIAIQEKNASFDEETGTLTISNDPNPDEDSPPTYYRNIARVLDGQHRIAGLADYQKENFDINVSIFVDIDIEDQAYIFSTVNLAQTKVNKSLAYDLFELAKAASPQKTCHNIAVALDQAESSPLHKRIKRLGVATPGRGIELLTQATFVESLLPFITSDPIIDRDILRRGNKLLPPTPEEALRYPFRSFFVAREDLKIADILFRYFSAVSDRWPTAWSSVEKGVMLNRTNGFRALMRTLMTIYRAIKNTKPVPEKIDFVEIFAKVQLRDEEFNLENFKPGTSGESALYQKLISDIGLGSQQKLL